MVTGGSQHHADAWLLHPCADEGLHRQTAGQHVSLLQLLTVRFGLQATLLLPFILATNHTLNMSPRVLKLTVVRAVLHIIGVGAMFCRCAIFRWPMPSP